MSGIEITKIKLSHLRAFAMAAMLQSFSKAALELDLNQSSISHAIAALEDTLGVMLLFRGRQGAKPTPAGQELLEHILPLLKHLDALVETADRLRGLEGGQVRITTIRSLGSYWLPQVLAAFQAQFPQVRVTVTTAFDHQDVQSRLRQRTADVGLLDLYDDDGLTVQSIAEDEYVAILPKHCEIDAAALSWEQISHYSLIMPSSKDACYDSLRTYLRQSPYPLNTAYEIDEDATIVSLAAQGLGMGILPWLAAIPMPETVRTYALPQPLRRTLAAAILSDALHSPAVFAFLEQAAHQPLTLYSQFGGSPSKATFQKRRRIFSLGAIT